MADNVRKVVSQARNATTALLQGEVVRLSAVNAVVRAQADSEANVTGVLGVVALGAGAGYQTEIATNGEALVRPEAGLTLAADEALYVSETVAGRLTNVAPENQLAVATVKDVGPYATTGLVAAIVDICCLVVTPPEGSLLTMSNDTSQVEAIADPGVETILSTGFGIYFHTLVDWDQVPGTRIRLHFKFSTAAWSPEGTTFRVRIGPPVQNQPDAISGTVRLTWDGGGLIHTGDYFSKPSGRQMLTVTVQNPDGAFPYQFVNPILFIESDVLNTRAMLLHGQTPQTPLTNQINNWTIDFDWLQSDDILVAMSALTLTATDAVTATMELRLDGTFDEQADGSIAASYSILGQTPIDEYMPTGLVTTIANPGGTRLVKWAAAGDNATTAQFKSVLLVGQ